MTPGVRRGLRLRDKLLISVTVLVVLLVSVVLATLNIRLQADTNQTLDNDLNKTLSVFSRQVEERLTALRAKARFIAEDPRLKAAIDVPKPNVNTTSEVCLNLNEIARENLFLVTDKHGKVLFDSFHIPEVILALREGREPDAGKLTVAPPVFADSWPNVQEALQGTTASGAFIYPLPLQDKNGKEIKKAFQTVTVPIQIQGEILGTLVLGTPLDDNLANQLKQMTDSEIAIDIGQRVYASTWAEDQRPQVEQTLAALGAGGSPAGDHSLKLGSESFRFLLSPFNDTRQQAIGTYVILRSEDKALRFEREIQRSIVIIGALGVLFAFAMALVIAQRITQPLTGLLQGVQEIARGNLNFTVPVKSRDELAVLADSFNQMTQGLKEKERVTNILGKYISPEVARKVLEQKEGVALKGERRECAVMFTDIRGFTAMSENASPEKIVADLNEYFTLMVDLVVEYEGTLDKFIGDAIMAVWGAPIPFEDKELRAVSAALDMQQALGQLNKSRIDKNQVPLTMGVGLNTGIMISGNLGSDKRTDYTVIGEEVNLASRLCSKAAPGQILISDSMYRKLKGLVEVRALDPISLKGFSEPVKVYEVIRLVPSA
jgi:class 3 adenylate cyclase